MLMLAYLLPLRFVSSYSVCDQVYLMQHYVEVRWFLSGTHVIYYLGRDAVTAITPYGSLIHIDLYSH